MALRHNLVCLLACLEARPPAKVNKPPVDDDVWWEGGEW